jgi:hypothetical protein
MSDAGGRTVKLAEQVIVVPLLDSVMLIVTRCAPTDTALRAAGDCTPLNTVNLHSTSHM